MMGDILVDDRKGDLWDLLEDLLEGEIPPTQPSIHPQGNPTGQNPKSKIQNPFDPGWWRVWLAATLATEQELAALARRKSEKNGLKELAERLVVLIETSRALPLPERVACSDVLTRLGDLRPGVGVTSVNVGGRELDLPQLEWCDIPAPPDGKVWLGADGQEDNPRRKVRLAVGL